jgi:hypothetical protein
MVQKSNWMKLGNRGFFPGSCIYISCGYNQHFLANKQHGRPSFMDMYVYI